MAGLEDLYKEIIIDHHRSPRNRGELETPPATRTEGFNPLCGDEIVVYLDVDDAGTIADVKIGGQGCSISQASASMMSAAVKGKSVADARSIMGDFKAMLSIDTGDGEPAEPLDEETQIRRMGDMVALKGVMRFPARIKCATLSWNTLEQAFTEAAEGSD